MMPAVDPFTKCRARRPQNQMETQYKIKTEPHPAAHSVTLWLNGKFSEESLPELDRFLADARVAHQCVYLDLSEVTLVDRKAVQYLAERLSEGVKLVNCPIYLQRWIPRWNGETER